MDGIRHSNKCIVNGVDVHIFQKCTRMSVFRFTSLNQTLSESCARLRVHSHVHSFHG